MENNDASHLGLLKASELHLSSEELIAVMNEVKAGRLSVDDALVQVMLAEQNHQATGTCQRLHEGHSELASDDADAGYTAASPTHELTRERTLSLSPTVSEHVTVHRRSASDSSLVVVTSAASSEKRVAEDQGVLSDSGGSNALTVSDVGDARRLLDLPSLAAPALPTALAIQNGVDDVRSSAVDMPATLSVLDERDHIAARILSDLDVGPALQDLPETSEAALQLASLRRLTLTSNSDRTLSRVPRSDSRWMC